MPYKCSSVIGTIGASSIGVVNLIWFNFVVVVVILGLEDPDLVLAEKYLSIIKKKQIL